jgi:conserved domain protein
MKRTMLSIGLFFAVSLLYAQDWEPKLWQKYVIEQKVKNDTLCNSGSILIRERMVEPKINSRAFYCGQFYVPDPPSLFAEQEKALERARWEDRDYTFGQAMGDLFLDFVGDIFAGALDNLLFKKR